MPLDPGPHPVLEHKTIGPPMIDLPPGAKCISSGWVFWVKRNADGSIECYKAHLVAKGYSQRPGFDYTEVFAPTFRYAAICTIITLAAINDLHLHSIDISHAFINGDQSQTGLLFLQSSMEEEITLWCGVVWDEMELGSL